VRAADPLAPSFRTSTLAIKRRGGTEPTRLHAGGVI
jgi:hypothetical protein